MNNVTSVLEMIFKILLWTSLYEERQLSQKLVSRFYYVMSSQKGIIDQIKDWMTDSGGFPHLHTLPVTGGIMLVK
jgi:hypothetical protein